MAKYTEIPPEKLREFAACEGGRARPRMRFPSSDLVVRVGPHCGLEVARSRPGQPYSARPLARAPSRRETALDAQRTEVGHEPVLETSILQHHRQGLRRAATERAFKLGCDPRQQLVPRPASEQVASGVGGGT